MALAFFPRGGSAHVARNLATALDGGGWDVTIVSGSLSRPGEPGDAREFYAGLDVRPLDMTRALEAPDPMLADPPMHPSYEDRAGAPDRIFASLDDDEYERQVVAWCHALQAAGATDADVLHLHHLTPIHEAAARVAPGVPVVGHLHGTELLMLEAIEADPGRWAHAAEWADRLRGWAAACERVIVLSETAVKRAGDLLGLEPDRCVLVPNGFDPEAFHPRQVDHKAHWRRHLVDEPRGWAPGEPAGSVAYSEADLAAFADDDGETPVLLYVGRFTEVKRLPLLIEAYEAARPGLARRAPLVIVGGFPGEWEGEHPLETIRRVGARGRVPRRLARPRRAARVPCRLRRRGAALGARAVRPGAGRGDGVRPAGDRGRRLGAGRHRRPRRDRLAGRARRPRLTRQRARPRGQLPARAGAAGCAGRGRRDGAVLVAGAGARGG